MDPYEWQDAPEWYREVLLRGLAREFGDTAERPREDGGDGSLNTPPPELLRHLGS